MIEKITWQSQITFGKHKGEKLLTAWIKDKDWFKWAIEEGLANTRPEIFFVLEEMTQAERKQFKLDM